MFLQDVSINFDMLIRVFFLQKLVHLMVLREGEEKKEGRMTFGLRGGNSLSFLSKSLDGLGGTPSIPLTSTHRKMALAGPILQ